MVATNDAWMEKCLIALAKTSGAEIQFHGLTETVDMDIGDKDIEQVVLVNGGRVTKFNPETETTVTLEAYPVEAGTATGSTGKGFFDLMQTADTTQPVKIVTTSGAGFAAARDKYRLAILWTDDTATTGAEQALIGTNAGLRFVAANGFITSVKPSFTDGVLKFTITFKVSPSDKTGAGQIMIESTDGTASMTILASYTASTKW